MYLAAVLSSVTTQLSWLSSTYYHSFLLPLLLACVALAGPVSGRRARLREAGRILALAVGGSLLYFLKEPFFNTVFAAGVANHGLLLAMLAVYAAFFSRLRSSTRVVVASAVFTEINWVFAITRLVLFTRLPLDVANIVQLALLAAAVVVIRLLRPDETERMPTAYWLTMLVICVISIACLFALLILESVHYNHGVPNRGLAVILPCFFVVSLLIYFLYYVLAAEHRKTELLTAQQIRQARDMEFYDRTQALCAELRSARHELKNHVAAMDALLAAGDYDGLRAYFAGYLGESREVMEEFHCENRLVSAVAVGFISAARAEGIAVELNAAVPDALPVAESDLCSLLSNLLENAVEGCKVAGGDRVRMTLHTDKGYLFVSAANPAAGDVLADNPALRTTKREAGHGCGVPLIRRIAEKYGGCAVFGMENGWFTADVMLCMEEAEE